jgi:hypothetical protein
MNDWNEGADLSKPFELRDEDEWLRAAGGRRS